MPQDGKISSLPPSTNGIFWMDINAYIETISTVDPQKEGQKLENRHDCELIPIFSPLWVFNVDNTEK
jgi:hypothetical protein